MGTWYEVDDDGSVDYDEDIQFFSDGTFSGFGEDGTYSIVDGQLVFRFQWAVSSFVYVYDFDFQGNELHLFEEDGDEKILQKEGTFFRMNDLKYPDNYLSDKIIFPLLVTTAW